MLIRPRATVLALLACGSCATAESSESAPRMPERSAGSGANTEKLPQMSLVDMRGSAIDLRQASERARFTVFVFFSAHCHVLEEHEPRLRALYDEYAGRGVQFFMVDSEAGGSPERDEAEAQKRGYPFPILVDRDARLADSLGAQYSTYSVMVDAAGRVRYRGGIDTDKTHLRENAAMYLKNAIDDLLAGRAPRVASTKALGCALQKW